ncbi:hypothetical protein [Aeromicrobium sp.]|uniref:hypothetical protein n=1 Tax=Aeromicrobium sp. TaxID=1871063 RepID=UPI003C4C3667
MTRLALLVAAATLILTGCTSSDRVSDKPESPDAPSSSTTSAKPPGATGPDCADVWKVGATLSPTYTSCLSDGAPGVQEVTRCDDGSRLVAYDDQYFAVTGRKISRPDVAPMQDTEEFAQAYSDCTGE